MQYKVLNTHEEWLPKDGIWMWKSILKGEPYLPSEDPSPAPSQGMTKLEDVLVGLQEFIDYWQSTCDHNMTRAYMGSHAYFPILDRVEGGIENTSHKRIHCRLAIIRGILATK